MEFDLRLLEPVILILTGLSLLSLLNVIGTHQKILKEEINADVKCLFGVFCYVIG